MRTTLATAFMVLAASPAFAQATNAAAPSGPLGFLQGPNGTIVFMVAIFIAFYFFMIRPQQQRQRQHQERINAVKRGDTVVMSSGMIGKVVRVEESEVGVEIAQGVTVKVVKSMIADIRSRNEPAAANDGKS